MAALVTIALAFVLGFVLRAHGHKWWRALFASCLVVPLFIGAVVILRVEGWEWWPIALIFGGLYGAGAGAAGVLIASLWKRRVSSDSSSTGREEA